MIVSELGAVLDELGSKVELRAISADEELQKAQFRLELASIYEALAKKFSVNEAIDIITATVDMFLETHSPS